MPTNYSANVQASHLNVWKNRLEMIDIFPIPEGYKAYKEKDTYLKFTAYMQEYLSRMMSGNRAKIPENNVWSLNLSTMFQSNPLPEDWWEHAMNVRKGGNPENNPLAVYSQITEEDKNAVNEAIMPMYRAVKERFDRRWFFEFFFNHAEYTAERDTLKAMEGLIMATTGQSVKEIGEELKAHQEAHKEDKNTVKNRLDSVDKIRQYMKNPRKFRQKETDKINKFNAKMEKIYPSSYEDMKREIPDFADFERFGVYNEGAESRGKEFYFKTAEKKADALVKNLSDANEEEVVNANEKAAQNMPEKPAAVQEPKVSFNPVSADISEKMGKYAFKSDIIKALSKNLPDMGISNIMSYEMKLELCVTDNNEFKDMIKSVNEKFDNCIAENKDVKAQMEETVKEIYEFGKGVADKFTYMEEDYKPDAARIFTNVIMSKVTAAAIYPDKLGEFADNYLDKKPESVKEGNVASNNNDPKRENVFNDKEHPFPEDNFVSEGDGIDEDDISFDAPSMRSGK